MWISILLSLAAALVASLPTGANATDVCIEGIHDCAQTATTSEGGFNPKNPYIQKHPTKVSTIEFLEYFSVPCLPIPLGVRRTYPMPEFEQYLSDLQAAGIISYKQIPAESAAGLNLDRGQLAFDVQLMPTIGPEHFKSPSCLKMSVRTQFVVTNWDQRDILTSRGYPRQSDNSRRR